METNKVLELAKVAGDFLKDNRGRVDYIFDDHGVIKLAALQEYGEAVRAESVKEKPKEIDPNKWAFDRGLESY